MKGILGCVALVAFCPCWGCQGKDGDPTTDVCGDIKAFPSDIAGGAADPDPSAVTMTDAQEQSVVSLAWTAGGQFCTGVLVSPRVVLTAAICSTVGSTSLGVPDLVAVGSDSSSPDRTLTASAIHVHPDFDEDLAPYHPAVIVLDEDATATDLVPIAIADVATSLVGEDVVVAGFGQTSPSAVSSIGTRRWATLTVDSEDADTYTASGGGTSGLCTADAGAPLFWMDPTDGLRVMGLGVGGEATCTVMSFFARVDLADAWLAHEIAASDPCDGETLAGRCDGETAIWCESDTLMTEDCAAASLECGLDSSDRYRCVSPLDPCDGETLAGRCDGDTAIWCESDAVQSLDCTISGQRCGTTGTGQHRCMDECDALGFEGECVGGTARWCDEGTILERDCAACDQACGDTAGDLGFYCI